MDYSLHISSCVNVATSEVDDFPSPYCTCCGFPSPLTQVSFICDNKRPGGKGAVQLLQRATVVSRIEWWIPGIDGSAHRGRLGVGAGEVAVERAGRVGEPERAGPLEEAWRLEAAGEEHELDIGTEVDDVEGERGGAGAGLAGAGRVALPAPRVLAAHVPGVACQVLGLHFSVRKVRS